MQALNHAVDEQGQAAGAVARDFVDGTLRGGARPEPGGDAP